MFFSSSTISNICNCLGALRSIEPRKTFSLVGWKDHNNALEPIAQSAQRALNQHISNTLPGCTLSRATLNKSEGNSLSLEIERGEFVLFSDERLMNEWLADRSSVDIWEIEDRRESKANVFYKLQKNGEWGFDTFERLEDLCAQLNKEYGDLWKIDNEREGVTSYIHCKKGFFGTPYYTEVKFENLTSVINGLHLRESALVTSKSNGSDRFSWSKAIKATIIGGLLLSAGSLERSVSSTAFKTALIFPAITGMQMRTRGGLLEKMSNNSMKVIEFPHYEEVLPSLTLSPLTYFALCSAASSPLMSRTSPREGGISSLISTAFCLVSAGIIPTVSAADLTQCYFKWESDSIDDLFRGIAEIQGRDWGKARKITGHGIPSGHIGKDQVRGVYFFTQKMYEQGYMHYHNVKAHLNVRGDAGEVFRFAENQAHAGAYGNCFEGIPTFHEGVDDGQPIFGFHFIDWKAAAYIGRHDVACNELPHSNDLEFFRAVHNYAGNHGYVTGFPTYQQAMDRNGVVQCGVYLITQKAIDDGLISFADVPEFEVRGFECDNGWRGNSKEELRERLRKANQDIQNAQNTQAKFDVLRHVLDNVGLPDAIKVAFDEPGRIGGTSMQLLLASTVMFKMGEIVNEPMDAIRGVAENMKIESKKELCDYIDVRTNDIKGSRDLGWIERALNDDLKDLVHLKDLFDKIHPETGYAIPFDSAIKLLQDAISTVQSISMSDIIKCATKRSWCPQKVRDLEETGGKLKSDFNC